MSHTTHLQFEDIDNAVLQRLCGALDSNLATLGKALDIQISRPLRQLYLYGQPRTCRRNALLLGRRGRKKAMYPTTISASPPWKPKPPMRPLKRKRATSDLISAPSAAASAGARRAKTAISAPCSTTMWCSAWGLLAPAKPTLAVAAARGCDGKHQVERIVLVRPAVEAGERLGFLPGDFGAKSRPLSAPAL